VYPSPAALITSVDDRGRANIITLGEVFNISIRKPVIVGIAIRPATYSHALIAASGEFVINLPTSSILESVDRCGGVSGRGGVDKFRQFNLTPVPASEVRPPLIEECPVNIECRVIEQKTVGDHDLFLGEVLAVHVDADKLDESGRILTEKLEMLVYVTPEITGEYWNVGRRLGPHGFTKGSG
jgi:flavin reductase (DIM6/NTAB) family NADH-FMN oxidoreductase RutF